MNYQAAVVAVAVGIALVGQPVRAQGATRERSGPVLSVGLGFGMSERGGSEDISESALAADIRLGRGVSEQIWVCAIGRMAAYRYTTRTTDTVTLSAISVSEVSTVHTLAGAGVTCFLNRTAPSPYAVLSVGHGMAWDRQEGESELKEGPGYLVGIGYESFPGLSLEIALTRYFLESDVTTQDILATVSWAWY